MLGQWAEKRTRRRVLRRNREETQGRVTFKKPRKKEGSRGECWAALSDTELRYGEALTAVIASVLQVVIT